MKTPSKNVSYNNAATVAKLLSTPFKVLSHNSGDLALFLHHIHKD
jgi:hypothetical protein